jgi:hypothetical protein
MKKYSLYLLFIGATLIYSCKPEPQPPVVCDPPPIPVATNNSPVSISEDLVLTAQEVPGATYLWKGPKGFTRTTRIVSVPFEQSLAGEYTVTATVNGCSSEASTYVISCGPITATSNGKFQEGDTIKLGLNYQPRTKYYWTGPDNFKDSVAFPKIPNATFAKTGLYKVYAKVGDCTSDTSSIFVTIFPQTPKLSVDSPKVFETLHITVTNPRPNTKYTFTGPDIKLIDTTSSVAIDSIKRKHIGTWLVIATSNGLQSETAKINVNVKFSGKNCEGKILINGYKVTSVGNQCWTKLNIDSAITWPQAMSGSSIPLQGKCKDGFHVPTDAEWTTLLNTAGNDGLLLLDGSEGGSGTYDFRARSSLTTGGGGEPSLGKELNNAVPDYWTSTPLTGETLAWTRRFNNNNSIVLRDAVVVTKEAKLRCIRD